MAQKQIFFLKADLAKPPPGSTVAPGSRRENRPEPPYNNFKVMNFNYQ